jgi:uncharacterized protein (TIRG00374 family)
MPPSPRADEAASPKVLRAARMVFRLLVAGVILFFLFKKIPIHEVASAVRHTRLGYASAAFLVTFLVHVAASIRLQKLCELQDLNMSAYMVFKINTAARFYSLFLPAGSFAAIAIRFYRLSTLRRQYKKALFAMLGDRLMATTSLCLVGGLFWILERPQEASSYLWWAAVALAALLTVAGVARFVKPRAALTTLMRRITLRVFGEVDLPAASAAGKTQRPARTLGALFLLSGLIHLLGILGYDLLCAAMGLKLSFVAVGWIRSAVILATMLPVSVSGIGLREGAMVLLLGLYNVPPDDALALSLVVFAVTVLVIGLIGGVFEAVRMLNE